MNEIGDIKEITKFLIFPLTIEGEERWWTTETYTVRWTHNIHSYSGEWEKMNWGKRKKSYPKGMTRMFYV